MDDPVYKNCIPIADNNDVDECVAVRGPVILVASSLGCWVSTIITLRAKELVKGNNKGTDHQFVCL